MKEKGMKWLCFMEMINKSFFCICYYQESGAVTWVHWINMTEWIKLHLLKFKILLSCKLKENYQAGLSSNTTNKLKFTWLQRKVFCTIDEQYYQHSKQNYHISLKLIALNLCGILSLCIILISICWIDSWKTFFVFYR